MQRVIPPSLNYANLTPEIIDNQIKIVKFTPVALGTYLPSQTIRFNIQGNGFLDPYSTYLRFKLRIDDQPNQATAQAGHNIKGVCLDRSGHSIITRFRVRCQGNELELIEQYDIMAAMINDILYSKEQKILHHFEGFGHKSYDFSNKNAFANYIVREGKCNVGEPIDLFLGEIFASSDTTDVYSDYSSTHGPISAGAANAPASQAGRFQCGNEITLCIPLYSGLLGVLMPEKRCIPLSLMPLEIEITVNPHAVYSTIGIAGQSNRNFFIDDPLLFGHMLYFEQEVHRSLEAVVAEHGIYMHINTFRYGPATTIFSAQNQPINQYSQINQRMKSINSVHWVYMYENFLTDATVKKLMFYSHRLRSMQVRNGTELFPAEPIVGDMANGPRTYEHVPFLIETYKAWNKMHDPTTDGAIDNINFCWDALFNPVTATSTLANFVIGYSGCIARSQYGISFEGEQLGQNKELLTGKRGLVPFDILQQGTKTTDSSSVMHCFCRADFIIFVRPDLVVQLLGF